jgi:hypothetical protein
MSLRFTLNHVIMCIMSSICWTNQHHRQHLQVHWNSSNDIFHSSGYLTVYVGDLIDFLCPIYDRNVSTNRIEYNTLYLVHEHDYQLCQTYQYHPLLICNRPYDRQRLIYTLSISKYLPYPNVPEFDYGQVYYFISTSSGRYIHIDQRANGLCQTKNMKLILNVEKFYRHEYEEQTHRQSWSKPIVAKRTNVTFIDPTRRVQTFSSSFSVSQRFDFILLLFCFLIDWRM